METIKVRGVLTKEERESHISLDDVDKMWILESMIPRQFRKALKQGWTPIKQYVYEDGTVCGMVLTAPERAITFRNILKKKMSKKQMLNLKAKEE